MRQKITDRKVAEFPVTLYPLQLKDTFQEKYVEGDRGHAIVRTDTNKIISTVTSEYAMIKHGDVMNAAEAAMQANKMDVEIVDIILFGKEFSNVAVRYLINYEVNGMKPFIELRNSYDRTTALHVQLGVYTLLCWNGMMGFKKWNLYAKHMGNGNKLDLKVFTKINEFVEVAFPELTAKFTELMNDKTTVPFIYGNETFPKYFISDRDASTFLNTKLLSNNFSRYGENLLGVLQAVTEFGTHYETSPNKMLRYQETAYDFITKHRKELTVNVKK